MAILDFLATVGRGALDSMALRSGQRAAARGGKGPQPAGAAPCTPCAANAYVAGLYGAQPQRAPQRAPAKRKR